MPPRQSKPLPPMIEAEKTGKAKVKFWMLHQRLTSIKLAGGKEKIKPARAALLRRRDYPYLPKPNHTGRAGHSVPAAPVVAVCDRRNDL